MSRGWYRAGLSGAVVLLGASLFGAEREEAVERGKRALEGRHFTPPTIPLDVYENLWKLWGTGAKEPPADYQTAVREHYGLHTTPYPNNGYPMGLRLAPGLFGRKMLATDCMLCHGGSICGQSMVGLGNASLDMASLFLDIAEADGMARKSPFAFANVRGTTEAGGFSVYLLGMREPDLKLRSPSVPLGLRDDLCEDTPAWWLLKKKKTMYYTGGGDARSVRSLMQFMMSPLNTADSIKREESTFADIRQYLLSLEPPRYPFPIDQSLAATGERVFRQNCTKCHGTYGKDWTYPNKIIPLKEIGTDPNRYHGISAEFARYYTQSWFGQEKEGWLANDYAARATNGYQAPPLDGIWATAPYFHNGSAPTVYDVLNSKTRPRIFTRSYRTDKDAYDPVKLGWKVQVLERGPAADVPAHERRKVYDTTQTGRSNIGHTYGDDLTEEERRAVIEYLKTL